MLRETYDHAHNADNLPLGLSAYDNPKFAVITMLKLSLTRRIGVKTKT
jgi:hypothetical protein